MLVYEGLAKAFAAEGVDAQFGLMGDGNMHWMSAMDALPGMTTLSVRHEHCSVLMAIGYWSATGKVGVCSVTHGPGFTQVMTGLVTAARNNVPIVMLAGETSLGAAWALQGLDQAPLAKACGAEYIQIHTPKLLHHKVREAFYIARTQRKPVVIGLPLDIQKMPMPDIPPYRPSTDFLPPAAIVTPDAEAIAALAAKLVKAECPVLVAGRGALKAKAAGEIEALADETGALLGTTLLGKGLYDHHPFSLGIVGGYARQASRDVAKKAGLVIAFGAQLSRFTLDNGVMFPKAEIVQVDIAPNALHEGLIAAHSMLTADARLAAVALRAEVKKRGRVNSSVRTQALPAALREGPADPTPYAIPDKTLDPRRVFETLETIIPKDYHLVSGSAHQAYWHTAMRGSPPENYHAIRNFGAIGNAMSFAIGVATGRRDGKVILVEGDGGMLMHIQELETLKRHGVKVLLICVNDGAFGAEIHKLRVEGIEDKNAVFGRPSFEGMAKALGLNGATITDLGQFEGLMKEYEASNKAAIWDVHVSDQVMAPPMRDEVAELRKK